MTFRRFRDRPIKQKLTAVIMLTCTVVLIFACAAFVIVEYFSSRRELLNTVKTLSSIAADNSTAALAFQNKADAERTLEVLQANPRMNFAVIYDSEDRLFVSIGRPGDVPPHPPPPGYKFGRNHLVYTQTIGEERKRLGTLLVDASMSEIYERLRAYLGITGIIIMMSSVAALICATVLRRRIASPILELAETTRIVSHDRNYAARATKHGDDELGELTDSFNHMLDLIQHSDADLRNSRERLGLALEAGGIGSWDWDLKDDRVYWDEFIPPLLGLRQSELGPTWEALVARVHPDDADRVRFSRGSVEQLGAADISVSFRILRPDGSVRYIASRGRLFVEGGRRRLTGVLIDVTNAKRAEEEVRLLNEELESRVVRRTEELAQANRDLESFTYSVSHDLRAPLRHINGFAVLLESEFGKQLPPEAKRLLLKIQSGARNMGQLVDDLLRLSRVGRQELLLQECSIAEVVNQVIAEAADLEGRNIVWKIDPLPTVRCDVGLIRQVFANLVANAVKYTRPRSPAVIEIGARADGAKWTIFVRDNGVGFDMKYSQKLFGVFQRLHRVEEFEGTGVGLAIAQRIVAKHNGAIWVEAELDKGACFNVSLPRSDSDRL
ncbi:MAG TPA: ATP-binding protein [Opitutaceae bacterium]|nr:ATP-binding protein [Opitutaceae bacterium]